jgi:hypothetical protein
MSAPKETEEFHSVESLELSLHHRFFTAASETEREQVVVELEELVKVYPNRRSNDRVVKVLGPVEPPKAPTAQLDQKAQQLIDAAEALLSNPTSDFQNGAGDKAMKILEAGGILLAIPEVLPANCGELVILLSTLKHRLKQGYPTSTEEAQVQAPPADPLPSFDDARVLGMLAAELDRIQRSEPLQGTVTSLQRCLEAAAVRGLEVPGRTELEAALNYRSKVPPVSPEPAKREIDLEQGDRFLALLGKDPAKTWIAGFLHKDNPEREFGPEGQDLSARNGKWSRRSAQQWQKSGHSIYAYINNGGTKNSAITSAPACFLEHDQISRYEQINYDWARLNFPEPCLKVDSGNKSVHQYWIFSEPIDPWRWRINQWRLVPIFNSDDTLGDLPQVMRVPGYFYGKADGSLGGQAQILHDSGEKFDIEAFEAALTAAENQLNLNGIDAIKRSFRHREEVQEWAPKLFPGQTYTDKRKKAKPSTEPAAGGGEGGPSVGKSFGDWAKERQEVKEEEERQANLWDLEELKEAAAHWIKVSKRKSGNNVYEYDRDTLWGFLAAVEAIELPRGMGVRILEELGNTEGWALSQVAFSGGEDFEAETFYWRMRHHFGYVPRAERELVAARKRAEAAQKIREEELASYHSELQQLVEDGIAGQDLNYQLLMLASRIKQPPQQVRKDYEATQKEVLGKDAILDVLDNLLKGDDPLIATEALVGSDVQQLVIDDFLRQFEAEPMLLVLSILATMGSVLPLSTRVVGLDHTDFHRPGVLYLMLLQPSGSKKTMLLDKLVEEPLVGGQVRKRIEEIYEVRNTAVKTALSKVQNGQELSPFDEKVLKAGPVEVMRHITSDFTGEGLDRNAVVIEQGYRLGFLLATDEGRTLLGGDRYKTGSGGSKYSIDKMKRAWDGKGPASLRADKNNERNYDRIRLGVVGFIQPEIYDQISNDEADDVCGFWPRFLALEADPVLLREGLTPEQLKDIASTSTHRRFLDDLYFNCFMLRYRCSPSSEQKKLSEEELKLHVLGVEELPAPIFRFSPEAQYWWYQTQCKLDRRSERELRSGDAMLGRLLGKSSALTLDLALLLHLLKEYGQRRETFFHSVPLEIPQETVELAHRLQLQLLMRTYRQRNRAHGDTSADLKRVLERIQNFCMKADPDQEGMKFSELFKAWNNNDRKDPNLRDLVVQAVSALADRDYGQLQPSKSNRGGLRYRWLKPLTGETS